MQFCLFYEIVYACFIKLYIYILETFASKCLDTGKWYVGTLFYVCLTLKGKNPHLPNRQIWHMAGLLQKLTCLHASICTI